MKQYNFSSDTTAPVCPEIMKKLNEINNGCMVGYQDDIYTQEVRKIMQSYFTKPIECYFNASGSGANVLAIKAMKDNYSSIICCDHTHINRFEVGGIEYNTGCKIVACDSYDGKLTVDMIKSKLTTIGNFNFALPKIVVLSQANELGLVYTVQELKEICDFAHQNELYVYVDGARLANAMAFLGIGFKEMLEDTGVDIASFGGNKNGAMFGEMIIILNQQFAKNFILNQKQSMQLFSKTRFLGAQFLALLENETWRKNALHANNMSIYFAEELKKLGFSIVFPVESNHVFVRFSEKQVEGLKKNYVLGPYDSENDFCRLMTNWQTKKEDIDEFIADLKKLI